MGHAYTPGLRVTEHAVLRRERRLPLRGDVLVAKGASVEADTVVARTELPGNIHTVNLASRLSADPSKVADTLLLPIGSRVSAQDPIAASSSMFGLVKNTVASPVTGTLESCSTVTGQLVLREPPIPVEVDAFVRGVVAEVLPNEGVVVETRAAFVQGIFGVGGETFGEIVRVASGPDAPLLEQDLGPQHAGKVVIGGAHVSHAALMRARDVGVRAVVVGGFDDRDLRELLGRDLGVAITGSEDLGITLVLTEGFGSIPMAERTWRLLLAHEGQTASVSGATQIRAGVMRPEILIPLAEQRAPLAEDGVPGLELGALVRAIREPYFGRIGTVVGLPAELATLESETRVRVLEVEFADGGGRATLPRANIELITP